MGCVRSVPLDGPRGPGARRREGCERPMCTAGSSTPRAVPARAKGPCEMRTDPTPPYRVPDFCPDCREKFLAVVGWLAPALESTLSPAPPVSAADVEPAGGEGVK